jgi:hypothetical protein
MMSQWAYLYVPLGFLAWGFALSFGSYVSDWVRGRKD